MGDPRPDKVAVVEEVKQKFAEADAAVLTEYRGLDVRAMAELRRALSEAGGEYKIYKNTLVRLAARDVGLAIEELLVGPTAIAFVGEGPGGSAPDAAAVAKALKDFAKTNEALVVKGGVLDDQLLSPEELTALAELPSREVLLAQLAGAFQAPLSQLAGLLQALPRDLAYGLQALIEKGGAGDAAAEQAQATDTSADTDDSAEDSADEQTETEEPAEATAEADDTASGEAGDDSGDAGDEGEA